MRRWNSIASGRPIVLDRPHDNLGRCAQSRAARTPPAAGCMRFSPVPSFSDAPKAIRRLGRDSTQHADRPFSPVSSSQRPPGGRAACRCPGGDVRKRACANIAINYAKAAKLSAERLCSEWCGEALFCSRFSVEGTYTNIWPKRSNSDVVDRIVGARR